MIIIIIFDIENKNTWDQSIMEKSIFNRYLERENRDKEHTINKNIFSSTFERIFNKKVSNWVLYILKFSDEKIKNRYFIYNFVLLAEIKIFNDSDYNYSNKLKPNQSY